MLHAQKLNEVLTNLLKFLAAQHEEDQEMLNAIAKLHRH